MGRKDKRKSTPKGWGAFVQKIKNMRHESKVVLLIVLALAVFGSMLGVAAASSISRAWTDMNKPPEAAEAVPEPAAEPFPASTTEPEPTEASAPTPEPEPQVTPGPADREIDFTALKAQNEDIVAWINVPGTGIDYPVVYRTDLLYLDHDIEGEVSKAGAIFLAPENDGVFTEKNTVIYGHNMKDGAMFAPLHNYEDAAFLNENQIIKIYTPEGQYNYKIFAAYEADDQNILYEKDYDGDDELYGAYQQEILAHDGENDNVIDPGLTVDDNILTLSTCIAGQGEKRYLVQGVLIDE